MPNSSDTPKTVFLRGHNDGQHKEYKASGAIIPGHLVALGSAKTIAVHAGAAGVAAPLFARELSYCGGDIDTPYANGDLVPVWAAKKGDEVYAFLKDGQTTAVGSYLESAGDGSLKVTTHGTGSAALAAAWPIAQALEVVAASGANKRVRIAII